MLITRPTPTPRGKPLAPNPHVAHNLALARQAFRSFLYPVWAPMGAQLVRTGVQPDSVTFDLLFFRWQVRITLEPFASRLSDPQSSRADASDVLYEAYIRSNAFSSRAADVLRLGGWRSFARGALAYPVTAEAVERALWDIKGQLSDVRDVNLYLNRLRR